MIVPLAVLLVALAVPSAAHAAPVVVSDDGDSTAVAVADRGALALLNSDNEAISTEEVEDPTLRDDQGYLRDLATGGLELVGRRSDGTPADDTAVATHTSPDARFVLFWSTADNLGADDADIARGSVDQHRNADLFLRDRASGTTRLVGPSGAFGQVSRDGGVVAFLADARLAPADTDDWRDAYVADLRSGRIVLASARTPRDHVEHLSLSGNGRYVGYAEAPESSPSVVIRRFDARTGRSRTVSRHRWVAKSCARARRATA